MQRLCATLIELKHREQNQGNGNGFDCITMGTDRQQQRLLTAVAHADPELPAFGNDAQKSRYLPMLARGLPVSLYQSLVRNIVRALDFARLKKVTYPSAADACGDLQSSALSVQGLPQFLFVRADGSVEQRAGGVDDLTEVVAMAEELLAVELDSPEAER